MSIEPYPNDNRWSHQFVSVNSENNIVGCLGYEIDWISRSVNGFYIVRCAAAPSLIFGRDILKAIDDIFNKYNLNRIEWMCYRDNPILEGYRHFCKDYGGREVGILHQKAVLMDGKIHDEIIFELMKEDYNGARCIREINRGRRKYPRKRNES